MAFMPTRDKNLNETLEKIINKDRRNFLKILGLTGVSLLIPKITNASSNCYNLGQESILEKEYNKICSAKCNNELYNIFQKKTNWCWAASMEMIFDYWGHDISQEKIVKEVYGNEQDITINVQDMEKISYIPWQEGQSKIKMQLNKIYEIADVIKNLENDGPVIICTNKHAVVLKELQYYADSGKQIRINGAVINDPARGEIQLNRKGWNEIIFAYSIYIDPDKRIK
jgi:hypothetical protein